MFASRVDHVFLHVKPSSLQGPLGTVNIFDESDMSHANKSKHNITLYPRLRHVMFTLFALPAFCERNPLVTGGLSLHRVNNTKLRCFHLFSPNELFGWSERPRFSHDVSVILHVIWQHQWNRGVCLQFCKEITPRQMSCINGKTNRGLMKMVPFRSMSLLYWWPLTCSDLFIHTF